MNKIVQISITLVIIVTAIVTFGCGAGTKVDMESKSLARQFSGNNGIGLGISNQNNIKYLQISIFNAKVSFIADPDYGNGVEDSHLNMLPEWKEYLKEAIRNEKDRGVNPYNVDEDVFDRRFDQFYEGRNDD